GCNFRRSTLAAHGQAPLAPSASIQKSAGRWFLPEIRWAPGSRQQFPGSTTWMEVPPMRHGRQHRRVLFLAVLTLAAALSALVGVQVAGTATAQASERPGRGTTVRTTINLPAFV